MHIYLNVYTMMTTVQWEARVCSDHSPEARYLAGGSFSYDGKTDAHDLLEETAQQLIAAYTEVGWRNGHRERS